MEEMILQRYCITLLLPTALVVVGGGKARSKCSSSIRSRTTVVSGCAVSLQSAAVTTEIKKHFTPCCCCCFYRVQVSLTHHHPLTENRQVQPLPSRWLQLMCTPRSVSCWASEVVSVGIVMKGAQSDAKNGYEAIQ